MLDTNRFLIENFQTPDGVIALLAKNNLPTPNREAARKWFSRGSMSADWYCVCLVALQRETGQLADIEDHLSRDDDDLFS